ncbi:acidic phospholipase A2 2-like [Physella acuta]|uniref:acidic phospholipase A2 2-like n=1 Tax=Physella acuta TaxID=109671 RepID=UPI0027DC6C4D|nr:acidic phospholipase A2 2-like [Physella acuta]
MNIQICSLTAAIAVNSAVVGSEPRSLHKRGLESLCILVTSMTSRNCWDFADYGCTCGLKGQSDLVPVDSVDRCCLDRLTCYQQLNCSTPFFIDSGVICTQDGCNCTDTETGSCEYQTCQCDLQFGLCLSSRGTFDRTYENYDRTKCKNV